MTSIVPYNEDTVDLKRVTREALDAQFPDWQSYTGKQRLAVEECGKLVALNIIDNWRRIKTMYILYGLEQDGLWSHHPAAEDYSDFRDFIAIEILKLHPSDKSRFFGVYSEILPAAEAYGISLVDVSDAARLERILPYWRALQGTKTRGAKSPRAEKNIPILLKRFREQHPDASPREIKRMVEAHLITSAVEAESRHALDDQIMGEPSERAIVAALFFDVERYPVYDEQGNIVEYRYRGSFDHSEDEYNEFRRRIGSLWAEKGSDPW